MRVNGPKFRWHYSMALPIVVCSIMGCGPSRQEAYPVEGTVSFQGQPLPGAQVMFFPPKGRPSSGETDATGHFKLLTWAPGDGAIEGEHIVCITKYVADSRDKADSSYKAHLSVLPPRFATPLKSDLRAKVSASGPNEFRFDLTN